MREKSNLFQTWGEASALARDVFIFEREPSILKRGLGYCKKNRAIKEAIMSVAEYQMLDVSIGASFVSAMNDHVWTEHAAIKIFCEREIEGLEKFPGVELANLLHFLEGRVRHVDNVIVALLAAAVGGLIDGLLGAMVS